MASDLNEFIFDNFFTVGEMIKQFDIENNEPYHCNKCAFACTYIPRHSEGDTQLDFGTDIDIYWDSESSFTISVPVDYIHLHMEPDKNCNPTQQGFTCGPGIPVSGTGRMNFCYSVAYETTTGRLEITPIFGSAVFNLNGNPGGTCGVIADLTNWLSNNTSFTKDIPDLIAADPDFELIIENALNNRLKVFAFHFDRSTSVLPTSYLTTLANTTVLRTGTWKTFPKSQPPNLGEFQVYNYLSEGTLVQQSTTYGPDWMTFSLQVDLPSNGGVDWNETFGIARTKTGCQTTYLADIASTNVSWDEPPPCQPDNDEECLAITVCAFLGQNCCDPNATGAGLNGAVLAGMRSIRDDILLLSQGGKSFNNKYKRHSLEMAMQLMGNSDLREQAKGWIQRYGVLFQGVEFGKLPQGQANRVFTPGDAKQLDRFLEAFKDSAGSELQIFIGQLQAFISQNEGKRFGEIFNLGNDLSVFENE